MPLSTDVKKQIMAEYGTSEGDTGSPEVQIALLTQRPPWTAPPSTKAAAPVPWSVPSMPLTATSRPNSVATITKYLESVDIERYRSLIKRLGLRR